MEQIRLMRYERHRQRELERQRKVRDFIIFLLTATLTLLAFSVAGTSDLQDEQRQLDYWADRGVTIQRW